MTRADFHHRQVCRDRHSRRLLLNMTGLLLTGSKFVERLLHTAFRGSVAEKVYQEYVPSSDVDPRGRGLC